MARPLKKAAKAQGSLLTPDEAAVIPVEEQPYPLPEGWKWVRLGDYNCYAGETVNPELFQGNMFELYSVPSSSFNYPEIILGKEIGSSKQSVEPDDVLLCKINPRINRVWQVTGYTNHRLIASSEWIIFRNKNILSKYMIYCMRSEYFREYMLSNVSGVGGSLMRAQPKHVRLYPIPLPPFEEQQRIVDRIESLFAKLDEAKEKAEAVLDGFETRKAAILHGAFTGELTAKWREERCLKKENNIIKIKTILSDIKYGTSEKSDYTYTGLPVIRIPNITGSTVNLDDLKFLKSSKSSDYDLVERNDILMIRSNGSRELVGKCALVDDAIVGKAYASYLIRLRPKPIINAKYLLSFLSSSLARNQLFAKAKSSAGINNINSKEICSVDIWLPHKGEQQEIVRILDSLLAKEQRAKESAETVLEQIELMKKAILARAFRGALTGPVT